jgi:hypothetical protein
MSESQIAKEAREGNALNPFCKNNGRLWSPRDSNKEFGAINMLADPTDSSQKVDMIKLCETIVGFVAVGVSKNFQETRTEQELFKDVHSIYDQIFEGRGTIGEVHTLKTVLEETTWTLSNGATFPSRPSTCYQVDLRFNYVGLVYSTEVARELSVDEAIEMSCLLNGAPDRINPKANSSVVVRIQNVGERSIQEWLSAELKSDRYLCFPVFYVKHFEPWCEDADELVERFPNQLAALSGSWLNRAEFLKASYVSRTIEQDIHPLIFGVTIGSPRCTIEFHPRNTAIAAEKSRRTLDENHKREWIFLTGILVLVAFQRLALEVADAAIDAIFSDEPTSNPFLQLTRLARLSNTRSNIVRRLNLYWNVQLARREYMSLMLDVFRKSFMVDRLYGSVRAKLSDVQEDIRSTYDTILSMGVFLLAIFTAFLAIAQLVESLPRK